MPDMDKLWEALDSMKNAVARKTALLDQLQATLDTHRNVLGVEKWNERQARIDIERLDVELKKLDIAEKELWLSNL